MFLQKSFGNWKVHWQQLKRDDIAWRKKTLFLNPSCQEFNLGSKEETERNQYVHGQTHRPFVEVLSLKWEVFAVRSNSSSSSWSRILKKNNNIRPNTPILIQLLELNSFGQRHINNLSLLTKSELTHMKKCMEHFCYRIMPSIKKWKCWKLVWDVPWNGDLVNP